MRMTVAPFALVVLGSLLGNSSVQGQPFGLNVQTLTLGASSFRPASGANTGYSYDISTDGYLHGDGQYVAPLDLPERAEIVGICADVFSTGSGGLAENLEAIQLPDSGAGGVYSVPGGDVSVVVLPVGFSSACNANPLDYVVRSAGDVGSGVRNLAHRIRYS